MQTKKGKAKAPPKKKFDPVRLTFRMDSDQHEITDEVMKMMGKNTLTGTVNAAVRSFKSNKQLIKELTDENNDLRNKFNDLRTTIKNYFDLQVKLQGIGKPEHTIKERAKQSSIHEDCPECGSTNIDYIDEDAQYRCFECGESFN